MEEWLEATEHLNLVKISGINVLLLRVQDSSGPYRWRKPRMGLGLLGRARGIFAE